METIRVERQDGVVTLTLQRPEKKNALNQQMYDELRTTIEDIAAKRDARVIIFKGAGGNFSSGADLSQPPEDGSIGSWLHHIRSNTEGLVLRLHQLPIPTIAVVEGVAVGAGLALALTCDLVVAAEDARFSMIFSKRGLALDAGATWLLSRLVGLHRAKEIAFLGEFISAQDALSMGIVNRVVPAAEVTKTAEGLARQLLARPPLALGIVKRALNNAFTMNMAETLEAEAIAQSLILQTEDAREAVMAFIEKREPQFQGR